MADCSYAELGERGQRGRRSAWSTWASQPGDKISILAHTRPEWTYACFGILTAGGTLVTIYQTNSPRSASTSLQHSDSRAVFVEDAEQLAKIREVEANCPSCGT